MAKPIFMHNCPECVFLLHFDRHDLYYCAKTPPLLKARFDHDDADVKSCIASMRKAGGDKHLRRAFGAALNLGLLFEDHEQLDSFGMLHEDWEE